MKGDDYRVRDRLNIDECSHTAKKARAGDNELYFPDHVRHESESTMKRRTGQRFVRRAEMIMRRYPWAVLSMGAGLGYLASRGGRMS